MENNRKKMSLVLHPVFFAAYPVLLLYLHNIQEAPLFDVILSIAVVVGVTLLLLLLGTFLFKSIRKTGVVLSVSLLLCFLFRQVQMFTKNLLAIGTGKTIISIWFFLFVVVLYFVVKTRKQLNNLTKVLNFMSGVLIVLVLVSIFFQGAWGVEARSSMSEPNLVNTRSVPMDAAEHPDIYYIIFDRYACLSTLKDYYNFDNSEFINYLKTKGFYVASESNANYLTTAHSLTSTLDMGYHNFSNDEAEKLGGSWLPLYKALQDHKVGQLLKARGYKYIHFGSWWYPTRKNKYADMNVCYEWLPEFPWALYKSTAFYPILGILFNWEEYKVKYDRILYQFEKLAEIPKMQEPTFVFAHFITPHPPYVFDKNGNFVSRIKEARKDTKTAYTEQLAFINQKIKLLIESLLADSERPPIIILQSDEGPWPRRFFKNKLNFNWKEATTAELKQKMGILNAYYLPNVDKNILYPSITPVNSFRLIFNLYFNGQYELLPDKSYIFEDYYHLYRFFDVTEKLQRKQERE